MIIGGRTIWNAAYADYTTILSKFKEKCQEIRSTPKRCKPEAGLNINGSMASAMTVHGIGKINVDGSDINTVD